MDDIQVDWEAKTIEIGKETSEHWESASGPGGDFHSLPKTSLGIPVGHCIYCVKVAEYPICTECIEEETFSNLTGECSACHKPQPEDQGPFSCCSACHFIRYCSKECQRLDWKYHKLACNAFSDHYETIKEWHQDEKRKMAASKAKAKRDSDARDSIFKV